MRTERILYRSIKRMEILYWNFMIFFLLSIVTKWIFKCRQLKVYQINIDSFSIVLTAMNLSMFMFKKKIERVSFG